jgi:hypothetical protein
LPSSPASPRPHLRAQSQRRMIWPVPVKQDAGCGSIGRADAIDMIGAGEPR